MAASVTISNNQLSGSVVAAKIVVNDDGETFFVPGDSGEYFDDLMKLIRDGVVDNGSHTFVTPARGEAYLDAVIDMFARSTAWTVSRNAS